ncbi:TPA: hypothetical protein ACQZB3_000539 [Escherichia coli]
MTVSTVVNHEQYSGNGVTTVFPYRFRILKSSHMAVTVSDATGVIKTLAYGTDYSITGAGLVSGGDVILSAPLAEGYEIALDRVLPAVQETDFRNQGRFFAETHEDAFDYLTMLFQQVDHAFNYLALSKPNALVDFYDALGQRISRLSAPVLDSDAVNKAYSDAGQAASISYAGALIQEEARQRIEADLQEIRARAAGDANLQSQLTGKVPLEASAFSVISWHDQSVENSVEIPANKNAWTFGPKVGVKAGQVVTISDNSFWTISNGREVEDEDLQNLIADTITTSDGSKKVDVSDIAKSSDITAISVKVETELTALTERVKTEEGKTQPINLGGTGAKTAEAARINLELGGAAVLNIGTTSSTVAAGDDPRFAGRLISVRRITSSQKYTPSPGMSFAIVDGIAGGGAGGGTPATSSSQVSVGTGGNSGVAARVLLTAAQIGTSQALTVGAAGAGVSGAAGSAGGDSIFGTLFTLKGGLGGYSSAVTANTVVYADAAGAAQPSAPTIATGTVLELCPSWIGGFGKMYSSTAIGGFGANSRQGSGGRASGSAANAATGNGAGGGGAGATVSTAAQAGGNGTPGSFTIYEYAGV